MAISADYVLHEAKGLKESFDQGSMLAIEPYIDSRMFNISNTSEWTEKYTSTEGMSGIEELSELQTPPVLTLEEGRTVTFTQKRFGGAIIVSEQAREEAGDDTTKVDTFLIRERDRLIRAAKQKFVTEIHKMYNESDDFTSVYLAPDGVEVYGDHTWANGEEWSNYTTAGFSESAYDDANEYAGAVTDSAGDEMPQTWTHIVVKKGSANEREARRLFAYGISPVAVSDINIYEGEITIISTPYISTTNKNQAYLLALGEEDSPYYVAIKKMPSLNDPQLLENESVRSNVTGFWTQGINKMPINTYAFLATA